MGRHVVGERRAIQKPLDDTVMGGGVASPTLGSVVLGGVVLGGVVLGGVVSSGVVLGGVVSSGVVLGGVVSSGVVLGGVVANPTCARPESGEAGARRVMLVVAMPPATPIVTETTQTMIIVLMGVFGGGGALEYARLVDMACSPHHLDYLRYLRAFCTLVAVMGNSTFRCEQAHVAVEQTIAAPLQRYAVGPIFGGLADL